jgi:hypothetical protein
MTLSDTNRSLKDFPCIKFNGQGNVKNVFYASKETITHRPFCTALVKNNSLNNVKSEKAFWRKNQQVLE